MKLAKLSEKGKMIILSKDCASPILYYEDNMIPFLTSMGLMYYDSKNRRLMQRCFEIERNQF
jgi:hypothetical protein